MDAHCFDAAAVGTFFTEKTHFFLNFLVGLTHHQFFSAGSAHFRLTALGAHIALWAVFAAALTLLSLALFAAAAVTLAALGAAASLVATALFGAVFALCTFVAFLLFTFFFQTRTLAVTEFGRLAFAGGFAHAVTHLAFG